MTSWDDKNVDTYDQQKIRLLLVDDEADLTTLIKMNLERLGPYEVRTVNNPRRALAAAQAFRPDLIIVDFLMPGMDGGQVVAAIRAEGSFTETPVLFLTGAVNRQDVSDWVDKISGPCLAKPVTAEELIAWIQLHLKK